MSAPPNGNCSPEKPTPPPITAEEFDRRFDAGEDTSDYFDWENAEIIEPEVERIKLELPEWVVASLDETAARLGTTRDALIRERLTASVTTPSP